MCFMKTQMGPRVCGAGPIGQPTAWLRQSPGKHGHHPGLSHHHPHPGGDAADCIGTTAAAEDGTQPHAGLSSCPSAPGAIVRERSPNPTPPPSSCTREPPREQQAPPWKGLGTGTRGASSFTGKTELRVTHQGAEATSYTIIEEGGVRTLGTKRGQSEASTGGTWSRSAAWGRGLGASATLQDGSTPKQPSHLLHLGLLCL